MANVMEKEMENGVERVKEPALAGTFYTSNREDLADQMELFASESKNYYNTPTRAVIVPHAGLVFSGRVAYEGINQIDKKIKNLFVIAPSHKVAFDGIAVSSYDAMKTPIGKSKINSEITQELIEKFGAKVNDETIESEHSLEAELPIIQSIFKGIKIIPIMVGKDSPAVIDQIISEYYPDTRNGFIISSDLSHFLTDEEAKKMDSETAKMIESGDIREFRYEQACGAIGIAGLVSFANKNNYSLIRIDMTNSSEASEDKSRVVGYGSWFLFEGTKFEYIEQNYKKLIPQLCKIVLKSAFDKGQVTIQYPQILDEEGACFVTLEKDGQLRGCIGSIVAHRPLITDLVEHTRNAAFNDKRFNPVTAEEIDSLKVNVSILTPAYKMEFESEEDLLNKITPNKDGIIIIDGEHQGVYLPSVWEEIPDKKEFLNSLKVKAGLTEDYWSNELKAYRFETIYLKEE